MSHLIGKEIQRLGASLYSVVLQVVLLTVISDKQTECCTSCETQLPTPSYSSATGNGNIVGQWTQFGKKFAQKIL